VAHPPVGHTGGWRKGSGSLGKQGARETQSVEHLPFNSSTLAAARAENSLESKRPRGLPPRGRSCSGAPRGPELTPEDIESYPIVTRENSLPT